MSLINIHRLYFPVTSLGYGNRLGVWVQGCPRRCWGCISPEMQSYGGQQVGVRELIENIPELVDCDGMTISGGEPFEQPGAVLELLKWFMQKYTDDVLIYTGYTMEELTRKQSPVVNEILSNVAAVVDGPYLEEENDGAGLRGSANQRLYVYKHFERYDSFLKQERRIQFVDHGDHFLLVGIPKKEWET